CRCWDWRPWRGSTPGRGSAPGVPKRIDLTHAAERRQGHDHEGNLGVLGHVADPVAEEGSIGHRSAGSAEHEQVRAHLVGEVEDRLLGIWGQTSLGLDGDTETPGEVAGSGQ